LLFAFKQAPPQSITDELEAVARQLQMRLLLDFPRYLRRICQGHALSDSRGSIEAEVAAAFCLPVQATIRGSRQPNPPPETGIDDE